MHKINVTNNMLQAGASWLFQVTPTKATILFLLPVTLGCIGPPWPFPESGRPLWCQKYSGAEGTLVGRPGAAAGAASSTLQETWSSKFQGIQNKQPCPGLPKHASSQ